MKIQSSNTKRIYSYDPPHRTRSTCPECSHTRKKKNDPCLVWDNKNNRGYCHNCGTAFFEYRPQEIRQYIIPEWRNKTDLTDNAVRFFEGRMISQDTLTKMRVYSDKEFMPQFGKETEVMCFPYFVEEKLVNIKYRGPNKSFKLVSGAELVFWNTNCLKDHDEVIIVEGEIDALTFIQAGYDNVISVPNGANKNLEYLDKAMDLFSEIKKIYIGTDQDTKGIELKTELIRRLGPERCFVVSFKDCKDANEYLCKYGDKIKDVIADADPVPIKGTIEVDSLFSDIRDLFDNGVQPGKMIDQPAIDEFITWETGRLVTVTGIPASGKSEFVDYIVSKLNVKHGWKAAYFTPENYPLKYHYAKMFEKLIGKKFSKNKASGLEWEMAFDYIRENFFYIMDEDDFTVDAILESARSLVMRKGIKVLVIDPFNKLEHQYLRDSETQYISKLLDRLIKFAKMNDLLLILVAHPKKMTKDKDGKFEIPNLYDISGSANFFNKTDYGITVHRQQAEDNSMTQVTNIIVQKIKFKHLGKQGIIDLEYDYVTGRYNKCGRDLSNWLEEHPIDQELSYPTDPEDNVYKMDNVNPLPF